ncbi:MAG: phenylacetate-CoA oxygenase subunit PaaJ [Nocardioidaceae bacterium]|nr:phenylacetate-CoA oxygenase subunit PaaJ [Nocardioidaceae bacterium]NUS52299.1 phenylacetate-CoA oxygenase subunit PaaJ [Nocardioidaceae bacterium]
MVTRAAELSGRVGARAPERPDNSAAWRTAAAVLDPEVPVLTIEDLGILRSVDETDDGLLVTITPTYSGCPAMEAIRADLLAAFRDAGRDDVRVEFVLAPAWTTDWMSDEGKRKLEEFGIAPPQPRPRDGVVALTLSLRCPQCGSPDTRELSRFGSTACKSLWVCNSCAEPFDHFKAI